MITAVGLCGDLPHSELGLVRTMGEEVDKNQAADASRVCLVHGLCHIVPLCPSICHNLSSLPGQLL